MKFSTLVCVWATVLLVVAITLIGGLDALKGTVEVLAVLLLVGGVYFFPAIVAGRRKHHNFLAILMLNLFLGWTFLGWVMALVWACTSNAEAVA